MPHDDAWGDELGLQPGSFEQRDGTVSPTPKAVSEVVETFTSPPAHTTEGGVIERWPGGTDGLSFKS